MPTFRINQFRVETLGRVFGTKAFVSALDDAIPLAYERAQQALEIRAEENGIGYAGFASERQMVEEWYGWWAPRLAGYSALVAIYSLVETELFACGDRMANDHPRGQRRGLERAASYLRRVAGVDVSAPTKHGHTFFTWKSCDTLSFTEEEASNVPRMIGRRYCDFSDITEGLWVGKRSEFHNVHVHVAPILAAEFATSAEEFFRGLMLRLEM